MTKRKLLVLLHRLGITDIKIGGEGRWPIIDVWTNPGKQFRANSAHCLVYEVHPEEGEKMSDGYQDIYERASMGLDDCPADCHCHDE